MIVLNLIGLALMLILLWFLVVRVQEIEMTLLSMEHARDSICAGQDKDLRRITLRLDALLDHFGVDEESHQEKLRSVAADRARELLRQGNTLHATADYMAATFCDVEEASEAITRIQEGERRGGMTD